FQNKPWFFAESIHSNSQLQAALSWGINFLQINNSNNIAKLLHGLFPEMVTTSIDATQHLLETLNFIKQNKKGNFIVFLDPLNHALNKGLSKNNFNELKITYQQNFTKMVSNSPEVVGIAANAITIQLAGGNINHQLKTILHTLSTYLYWISEINLIQSIKNV